MDEFSEQQEHMFMAIPLFDMCTHPLKLMWGAPELMFCASNRTASGLPGMGSAVGLVPGSSTAGMCGTRALMHLQFIE